MSKEQPVLKVLNLYAGIGGNRKLWQGVEVTAVESDKDIAQVYKNNFPNDEVIIGDAHKYMLDYAYKFDFVWASPPCQTHSRMMKATRHKNKRFTDLSLYQEILFLQHFYKGKWVVENVRPYYEPLIKPTVVLGRHLFWSNFLISEFYFKNIPNFIQDDTVAGCKRLKDWLGIHYEGVIYYKGNHSPGQVLRNCIHPKIGLHILECFKGNLLGKNDQLVLFDTV